MKKVKLAILISMTIGILGCDDDVDGDREQEVKIYCQKSVECNGETSLAPDSNSPDGVKTVNTYDYCIEDYNSGAEISAEYEDAVTCILNCSVDVNCTEWEHCGQDCQQDL